MIPTRTDGEKIVSRNDNHVRDTPIQVRGNDDDRRIQKRSNRSGIQHRAETQDISDYFLLP